MIKLTPQDARLIASVHSDIASQPWFHRNAVTETELLKMILQVDAAERQDEAGFTSLCASLAKARFSRSV